MPVRCKMIAICYKHPISAMASNAVSVHTSARNLLGPFERDNIVLVRKTAPIAAEISILWYAAFVSKTSQPPRIKLQELALH